MRWYTASDAIRASGLKFRNTVDIWGTLIFLAVIAGLVHGIWRIFA